MNMEELINFLAKELEENEQNCDITGEKKNIIDSFIDANFKGISNKDKLFTETVFLGLTHTLDGNDYLNDMLSSIGKDVVNIAINTAADKKDLMINAINNYCFSETESNKSFIDTVLSYDENNKEVIQDQDNKDQIITTTNTVSHIKNNVLLLTDDMKNELKKKVQEFLINLSRTEGIDTQKLISEKSFNDILQILYPIFAVDTDRIRNTVNALNGLVSPSANNFAFELIELCSNLLNNTAILLDQRSKNVGVNYEDSYDPVKEAIVDQKNREILDSIISRSVNKEKTKAKTKNEKKENTQKCETKTEDKNEKKTKRTKKEKELVTA